MQTGACWLLCVVVMRGDGRVSQPWPDCLHTSRSQDRRCCSQHGDGMVGRRPGLAANALSLVKTVGDKCQRDKEAGRGRTGLPEADGAGAARLDLSKEHLRTQTPKVAWSQLELGL